MPGIFGFTHEGQSQQTHNILERMAEALRDESHYRGNLHEEGALSFGRIGLSIIQPHPQPGWNESRTIAVIMEGEIYDDSSLKRRLEQSGHRNETNSQSELLAHAYEEKGSDFVSEISGAFVAAIWDRGRQTVMLVTDHLALYPIYYTSHPTHGFAFASGVRALLALPWLRRSTDQLAIAQFLTFDHVLGDRTLLVDVKQLPGGSILTFNEKGISVRQYWRAQYPEFYPVRDEASYSEELSSLLRQATIRQMPGQHPAGILLSGGLDSRVVAGLLREQQKGEEIQTFTMGQPGCDDERYAKELSNKLSMPHTFYKLEGNFLLDHANHGVRLSDGMGNVVHMHTLPHLADQARRAQIIYKGFLGDALIGYGITERLLANYSPNDLPLAHFAVHQDQGLILFEPEAVDQILPTTSGAPYSQQIIQSYTQALRDANTPHPADQRNYFDLTQRVPRMTLNGVEWVRSQSHVRLPFADKQLVEFMLTVPPGFRIHRKIIKDLFIHEFPDLAKVPYTETNYPMVHSRREVLMRGKEQMGWWLRSKGFTRLPIPEKRRYANYNEWLRGDLRPWVEEILLGKTTLARGLFNPGFLQTLIAEHIAGKKHYTRLGALISVELWHRLFID